MAGRQRKTPSETKPGDVETKKVVKEQSEKQPMKFECGYAPPGSSTTTIVHDGQTYNLALDNKIWIMPEDFEPEKVERYRTALLANNFLDITVNIGVVFDAQTGEKTYKAMHPEHTERNRINATIALNLVDDNGKQIIDNNGMAKTAQVTINQGVVVTNEKLVYEALIRAGFVHVGITEKE